MPTPLLPARAGDPDPWDQALMAFLAEKLRRSGSQRTAQGYSRMLFPFFARLGKTPDQVTPPEVMGWAHGVGLSGRTPSSTTIGARIACLSSYYRFLRRMELVASNPCDALERPQDPRLRPTCRWLARSAGTATVRRCSSGWATCRRPMSKPATFSAGHSFSGSAAV